MSLQAQSKEFVIGNALILSNISDIVTSFFVSKTVHPLPQISFLYSPHSKPKERERVHASFREFRRNDFWDRLCGEALPMIG